MRTKKLAPESEAEVLCQIRNSCDQYFHDQFPKDSDSVKGYGGVEKLTGEFLAKKLKALETKYCDSDMDDIKLIVANGNALCPILRSVATMWKVGGFSKNR